MPMRRIADVLQAEPKSDTPKEYLAGESYVSFLDGIKARASKKTYQISLALFCRFVHKDTEQIIMLARQNPNAAYELVKAYLRYLKSRVEESGDLQPASAKSYYTSVKLLLDMNDIMLNWRKLSKMLPAMKTLQDRGYSKQEVNSILKHADLREKVAVLLMATGGLRIGAIPYLRVQDVTPITIEGSICAARLVVYPNTPEQYLTFVTPECYRAVSSYLDYRKRNHEQITPDSPVIRNTIRQGVPRNASSGRHSKKVGNAGLNSMVHRLLIKSGVRILQDRRRYDVKMSHGFRKFFNTQCKLAHVDLLHKEMMMGHYVGMDDTYYRPPEEALLQDYLKAVPSLTFDDSESLKAQNVQLKKKVDDIEAMKQQIDKLTRQINRMHDRRPAR